MLCMQGLKFQTNQSFGHQSECYNFSVIVCHADMIAIPFLLLNKKCITCPLILDHHLWLGSLGDLHLWLEYINIDIAHRNNNLK